MSDLPTDYRSMARLARSMLEQGRSSDEVLRSCYGVSFPTEFFVLAEMKSEGVKPPVSLLERPWNLLRPLAKGGPPAEPGLWDEYQHRISQRDPSLIALLRLGGTYPHRMRLLCYRRDELAAGRSTIFSLPEELGEGWVAERAGESLGSVLRAHLENELEGAEHELDAPSNRGAGSIDGSDVEYARRCLQRADDLIAVTAERLAGRTRPQSELPWRQRARAQRLVEAAEADDVKALRALIEEGASLEPPGEESALGRAIERSSVAAARFLLDAGAKLNHRALTLACRNSSVELVELLLERGASLAEWDAISSAMHRQDKAIGRRLLSLLVKRGIDANAHCTSATILMAVCMQGDLESARRLLDRGADPNFRHFYGTALTVAEENGHQVVVDLLLERGAKPDRSFGALDHHSEALWKAAREEPHDAQHRVAWAQALLSLGLRAAAAHELQAAQKLGAVVSEVVVENPAGTTWRFGAVEGSEVAAPIDDARYPGATVTSGARTLPLVAVLGPACTHCDERCEVTCPECNGTGVGDNYLSGGTFECAPRVTCPSCCGLKYVVRSSPVFGKGPCRHEVKRVELELPPTRSSTFTYELKLNRCVACGLPAMNDWWACGVCGFFVCRCVRGR